MTDYGSMYEDREERRERLAREAKEKAEAERKRVDEEFEQIVLKKRKSCSANSDLVKFVAHLKTIRAAMKAANDDGFCMDEIMDGLEVLGDDKA